MSSRRSSYRAASSTSSFADAVAVAGVLLVASGLAGARADEAAPPAPAPLNLSVALRDGQAWVGGKGGVEVYDVREPDRPVHVERIRLRATVEAVAFRGDQALLAVGSHGLYVLDVADLEQVALVARFDGPGRVRDVMLVGDQVWIAAQRQGLSVVDLRFPEHPLTVATVSTTGEMRALARDGDRVAAAEGQAGVRIFDASRPGSPRIETVVRDAEGALDVAFAGGRLLVAAGRRGLLVYPASSARLERPQSVPAIDTAIAVTFADGLALVANHDAGLQVIDLDGDAPRETARVDLPRNHSVESVVYRDGFAFVAAGQGPLAIVDLREPTEPRVVFPAGRKLRVRFP